MKKLVIVAAMVVGCVAATASTAWAQLELAAASLRSGDYARAEQLARQVKGAREPEAALVLGRVQLETGRYDEAARTAVAAQRSAASKAAGLELAGEAALRQGRLADAITALEGAVAAAGAKGGWRARVLLARAHRRNGNVLAARPLLEAVADAYNDGTIAENDAVGLAAVANAVEAMEYWQDANETYMAAAKLDARRVETQLDWARLFLSKYDPGHAEECLNEALEANPSSAEAHALMAKVRMAQGFDFLRAGEELAKALAVNPRLVEAHAFAATLDIRDHLFEKAHERLDRALAVDPSDPYALSVKAAAYFVADDLRAYEKTVAKLRSRDRRYSGHVHVLTDLLEWEHRYDEIVSINQTALADDAGFWPAHAAIGINLLRLGDEGEGLRELNESWSHDRFNVLVYNMLNLYDDVLTKEYAFVERGPITYRFHKNDQRVLERYLPDLLGRAFNEMSTRYGIRPAKTKVEVFAEEDHFARRSVGLPRVGVQGICFGKVVVAGGPRAASVNVGQVLWHELAHVFTIQASRSRVPRWLTEGLSVLEESRGSPQWVRGDDAALYRWVKAGRMPSVEALNTAFSRARSGPEIGLAYYGSAKLVEHIERQHGLPKLVQMLKLFGQGKRSADVIRTTLKMEPSELDRQFQDDLVKRLARYEKNFQVDYGWDYDLEASEKAAADRPSDAAAQGQAAVAALASRDKAKAETYAAKALKLDPAQPHARHVLSDIATATKSFAKAREHAQALLSKGVDGYGLRLNLVEAAAAQNDAARVIEHLKAAASIDPQQAEPHLRLAKLHLDAGREADGLRELGLAADLDPHDGRLHRELVARLAKRGDWAAVVRYGERSLYIDPFDAELHLDLAKAYGETGNAKRAVFEYESALLCEPDDVAAVHLELARFYQKTGKRQRAAEAARRGVEAATKSSAAAQKLLDELEGGGPAGATRPPR